MRYVAFLLMIAGGSVGGFAAHAQINGMAVTGQRVACMSGRAAGYGCSGVDLLAFLPRSTLGAALVRVNDLWGWTDPETGKEYALVGRENGTAFVEISDPVNPVYVGDLPTYTQNSVWRDVKVHANHAFIVADAAGDHGIQIFDLTQLRTVTNPPVTFAETAHYAGFGSAHNIAINEDTGFAYAVGGSSGEECGGGLHMVNVQHPTQPTFAGCFNSHGATHDAQCVVYHGPDLDYQGREVCMGANGSTSLSIADVTDKAQPVGIATTGYPNQGYIHQGWLTEDHRYFFLGDEFDELNDSTITHTRTLIFDLSDLDDPMLAGEYFGEATSIDHNMYVRGDVLYQANYTSGLRILDISDPLDPHEIAFFDTVPANDDVNYNGAWSVYPFFPSGTVVVSSRSEGLFVLAPTAVADVPTEPRSDGPDGFTLSAAYPNPFNPQTTLALTLDRPQPVRVAAYDALGREVAVLHAGPLSAGAHRLVFEAGALPSGVYAIRASGAGTLHTQLVTRTK